jgi:hypothetical protein
MPAMSAVAPLSAIMAEPLLEDVAPDPALVAELAGVGAAFAGRPLRLSTPTFRAYDVEGMTPCRRSLRFPAFSITGPACALGCKHCRAKVLEPMIPTGDPAAFERLVRLAIARDQLQGFLLSGGSNRRNEVAFERYMPVVARLKRDHPRLQVAVHTGLVDQARAACLADAGVDVAMIDIIGADATIREVYHLNREVEAFQRALACLVAAGLRAVPHIVIGLHFGRLLGERRALEIIASEPVETVILVVLMPDLALPGTFATPDPQEVGRFFAEARERLADRLLLLGCARPMGEARRLIDLYALIAGLDGIAYPSAGIAELAARFGRPVSQAMRCCGLDGCAAGTPSRALEMAP